MVTSPGKLQKRGLEGRLLHNGLLLERMMAGTVVNTYLQKDAAYTVVVDVKTC